MSNFEWIVKDFSTTGFTAFDTETTGLEPKTNRVVEVGGIKFDSRGEISRFNTLVDPHVPMPPEVTKINGITDAMLKEQPDAAAVLPDFLRFIGKTALIAHNAQFDVNFINEELKRIGLPPILNRVIDTRLFAREMFPGLPKYALQDLAVRFGINAVDAHRAEDDARVCMELFRVCVSELSKRMGVNAGELPPVLPKSADKSEPEAGFKPQERPDADLFYDEYEGEDDFSEETID